MKRALTFKRLLLALGLSAFCISPFAVFDPVNDDTDLFRNNPNIPSERPNVLIILDNTANWTTNFAAEKSALVTLVTGDGVPNSGNETGLDSSFNVGLMIFGQTGNACQFSDLTGSPVPDGGYVRFGIRQMTSTNKTILSGIVNSFADTACAQGGDQGNAANAAQAMHEAYLYYGGLPARHGISQIKRDYAGSDSNNPYAHPTRLPTDTSNTPYPLASQTATTYTSAITADCQKSYIIYISNGKVDSSDNNPSATLFSGGSGLVPNAQPFALSPSGFESSWMDEYASYLANVGVTYNGAQQYVYTYTIDVAPGTQPADLQYTALLQSAATRGKGRYFGVSGANVAQELVAALKSIFSEINAVNSVFAASTLPVSVNVRGTNLNQLYIGVFRPDSGDLPRWYGNLKAYQLQQDPVTGLVRSVDANTDPAIDDNTGFVKSDATSFWTQPDLPSSTYWSFLDAAAQGVGGASDSPDGNLVEKGGGAQRLRSLYDTNGVNGSPTRPVYTCTDGTLYTGHVCAAGTLLSETPFSTDNTDITASALNITSRTVSTLSAATTKAITALIDRRPVSLDNSSGSVDISSISVPTTTLSAVGNAVTAITNSTTFTITAMSNGAATTSVSMTKSGTGNSAVSSGTVAAGHNLVDQQLILMAGCSAAFNTTTGATITYVSATVFTYALGSGNASDCTGTMTTSLTTTTVTTSVSHNLSVGDRVTISGASLTTTFTNSGSPVTITGVPAPDQFTYATAVSDAPVATGATAVSRNRNAVATTNGTHPLSVGSQFTMTGAVPAEYNGTWTVTALPASNQFSFTTSSAAASDTTTQPTTTYAGTTANVTTSSAHAFDGTSPVTIFGTSPSGYNVTATPTLATPGTTTFSIAVPAGLTAASGNPVMKVTAGYSTTVTATLANHGYVVGDYIDIRNVDGVHSDTFQVDTVPTTGSFTYTDPSATAIVASDSTGPQVRYTRDENPPHPSTSLIRAYATVANHGYGNAGDTFTVTISGADSDYNFSNITARVEDANSFSYPLGGSAGGAAAVTGSALTDSTTAVATATAHGFTNGEQVTITGATVAAFNGLKTITYLSADSFSYTVSPAQGVAVASPTILAAGQSERTQVINWIRGENNKGDDGIAVSTKPRPSIHGDVLHSRPAVVNYNRLVPCNVSDTDCLANVDNDVYIFYGGNDGLFRAVKGGLGSASGDPAAGTEVWAFAAPTQFGNLRRLRQNSPPISSTYKKPYFFDGPIGVYTRDTDGDGRLLVADADTPDPTSTTQDKVWIYLTMRRGGRFMYALDISQPLKPRLLWRKGCPSLETDPALIDANGCDLGFGELGQTWSEPKVVSVNCVNTTKNCGANDPVLIFGGGYDELVEDPDPATVNCAAGGTSGYVRTGGTMGDCSSGTLKSRSMGRAIFVVNARTGKLIFRASGQATPASIPTGSTFKVVSGMDFAIPSDIAVVVGDPVARPFRAYVGDTGGQLWRFDFGDLDPANWALTKLASVADLATTTTYTDPISLTSVTAIRGMRKFQFAPDVVSSTGFDMIVIGSGDREHPFDTTVLNRVYGFKDTAQTTSPPTLTTITHAATVTFNGSSAVKALLDVTNQCIEIAANCTSNTANHGGPEQVAGLSGSGTTPTASENNSRAVTDATNKGWFIELAAGEKQVGSTLASGSGVVQFGTNQPSLDAGGGTSCSPNLGVARQYQVNYLDGTAFNGTALSTTFSGGGYLPSPVLVYVSLGGASGTGDATGSGVAVGGGITSGSSALTIGAGASTGGSAGGASAVVCYGAVCSLAPGSVLFSRVRKFWYKEID